MAMNSAGSGSEIIQDDVGGSIVDAFGDTKEGIGSLWEKNGPQRRVNQLPNMRCKAGRFIELVGALNGTQRKWVVDMGFGELLKLSVRKLDRNLCLWLMNRFDPNKKLLVVRENHYLDVTPNDVGWVMGIPGPNRVVRKDIATQHLCSLKKKYRNDSGIDERGVFATVVEQSWSEGEFKESFLLYTLGVLLCPTQSCRISPAHLKVIHNAKDAQNYNWCWYVFDWLVMCVRRFKGSKSTYGGYGGCALFLMVFYLDRINIGNPVNWSMSRSRVDAWDSEMIRYVIREDRKSKLEFGRCELVSDVIYGAEYPIGCARVNWEDIRKKIGSSELSSCDEDD